MQPLVQRGSAPPKASTGAAFPGSVQCAEHFYGRGKEKGGAGEVEEVEGHPPSWDAEHTDPLNTKSPFWSAQLH